MTLDVDAPAPCRPWKDWRPCTCPECDDVREHNHLRDVVLLQLRYRNKIVEWCEDWGSDPLLATDPSLADLDAWILAATGHASTEVEMWMDVARFHGDDSQAPCCAAVMVCYCPACGGSHVPKLQSLPVVTGRLLEGRADLRWHIADTKYMPVDHMVDLIDRVDTYLAQAHGLDMAQRHALSGFLDDGALTFDQALRALRLVSAQ